MQDFRDLKVWEKAHQLTLRVYRVTHEFPRAELYGLTSQMRRAAVSIGANIAEGCCRNSGADFARFLQIAMGSAGELEYEFLVAHDLRMIPDDTYTELVEAVCEVKRMLTALMAKAPGKRTAMRQG